MISTELFSSLTATAGLRISRASSERRGHIRVPCSVRTIAFSVFGDKAEAPVPVRVKDISHGGVGVLFTTQVSLSNEFVLKFPSGGEEAHFLLCTMRRLANYDGVCSVAGCAFLRLLASGQRIEQGTTLSMLVWEEVGE